MEKKKEIYSPENTVSEWVRLTGYCVSGCWYLYSPPPIHPPSTPHDKAVDDGCLNDPHFKVQEKKER